MKKFISTIVLSAFLSIAVAADEGTTHTGGRNCPTPQPCRVQNESPANPDETVFTKLFDFLKSVFG